MQIRLVQGDIVDQQVDAVVNAANNSLLGGGGVDGALVRAGGDVQMQGRLRLRETDWPDGLPTGQAAASEAGDLAARWVIHVVGPVHSTREDRSHLLVSCYREALRVADELGCRSVAFPAVSAGVYGWPMGDAARVAVHTVRATATRVEEARFVLFSAEAYTAFATALTA